MRIAQVIGSITLNRWHDTFAGAQLKLVVPMTLDELAGAKKPMGDSLVVWDPLGAGVGQLVSLSEGGEAAQPFRPLEKPVDAYLSAILDDVHIDHRVAQQMLNKS